MGLTQDLIGDEYDLATSERNGYGYTPPSLCEGCGGPYKRSRKDQRFCSIDCRKRTPRPARTAMAHTTPPPRPTTSIDLPALLGQLVVAADEWRIDAWIGDVHVHVAREAR